jgi:Carbohydrate/starch-binding module (family 21)
MTPFGNWRFDVYLTEVFVGAVQITGIPDRGPGTWNYVVTDATIFVHNLSYNKDVGLHINVDGNWLDMHASYSQSLLTGGGSTIEVWEYHSNRLFTTSTLLQPLKTFQLAVFYHNLDWNQWYWDDNSGQDYSVTAIEG